MKPGEYWQIISELPRGEFHRYLLLMMDIPTGRPEAMLMCFSFVTFLYNCVSKRCAGFTDYHLAPFSAQNWNGTNNSVCQSVFTQRAKSPDLGQQEGPLKTSLSSSSWTPSEGGGGARSHGCSGGIAGDGGLEGCPALQASGMRGSLSPAELLWG